MEQHMESPTRGAWQGVSAEETAAVLCLRGSYLQKPSLEALEAARDTDPFPSLSSCPCEMVLPASLRWIQRRGKDLQLVLQPRIENATPESHPVFQERGVKIL